MEGCEERERKLWTGFHLGSAIFITHLPEQGPLRLPGRASQPSSSPKCASPGRLGPPPRRGAPCRGGCLEKGQRRLKGKRNKLAHLVPPFSPALTDPLRMSQQTSWGSLGWLLPLLQLQSAPPRTPAHPLLPGRQPPEDCRQGVQGSHRFLYSPTGLNSASRHILSPAQLGAPDWTHGSCCKNLC